MSSPLPHTCLPGRPRPVSARSGKFFKKRNVVAIDGGEWESDKVCGWACGHVCQPAGASGVNSSPLCSLLVDACACPVPYRARQCVPPTTNNSTIMWRCIWMALWDALRFGVSPAEPVRSHMDAYIPQQTRVAPAAFTASPLQPQLRIHQNAGPHPHAAAASLAVPPRRRVPRPGLRR